MARKKVSKKKTKRSGKKGKHHDSKADVKKDNEKLMAFVAVFFTIIGFIVALIIRRNDKYIMYYAKQGLVLFIAFVLVGIIGSLPGLAWLSGILWILVIVLWIIAWINAISGQAKKTFIISEIAEKIDL
ncbi:hypothetical protein GOV14_06390 [Candidatus Pacearchaeota archaeon]|nr:hypothetical protein [Candidatus Pacearchaeota archaeon]